MKINKKQADFIDALENLEILENDYKQLLNLVQTKRLKKYDKVYGYFIKGDDLPFDWSLHMDERFLKKDEESKQIEVINLMIDIFMELFPEASKLTATIIVHRDIENITQVQLAEKIGVTSRTIKTWEKNSDTIPFNKLKEMAEILNFKLNIQ